MLYRKRKLTRVVSEIRLSRCIKVATCFSSEIFCSPPKILVHVLLSKNSPLRVNFLAQKYFSLCGFLCRRLFFSMRVSSLKNLFLPIHFVIFFVIFIWQPILSMEFFVSFLEMRVNIGSLYMCGLLGDFSKDAVVSYLVSDKAC